MCNFAIFFSFLLTLRFYLHDVLGKHGGYSLRQMMTQNHAIRVLGYFERQIQACLERAKKDVTFQSS